MAKIVLNGEFIEEHEGRVAINDRGLILGDGVFETMRSYDGRVFRLEAHLARLMDALSAISIEPPFASEELAKMVERLIGENELESARVRLTVTRGKHEGSMGLPSASSPTLIITAAPLPPRMTDEAPEPARLITADTRFSENNPLTRLKTLGRLPNLAARAQAERAGAHEALILDERGNVACVSTGNFFAVQYEQLFTPPLKAPVLPGITRAAVLELADSEGIGARTDFFSPIMLAGADEAFYANSVKELVPVVEVDGRRVGSGRPGPVCERLSKLLRELAEEEE